jgi:two-component system chemotaxis response regulator CheB
MRWRRCCLSCLPVVIVQHMPPPFTKLLAERLDSQCHLRVREGKAGSMLQPGTIWIAPGDHHMVLERAGGAVLIRTDQAPPENSCRPAADVLFRSVASVYEGECVGLRAHWDGTGRATGLRGDLRSRGQVVVQDAGSSVIWGMPGYVAQAEPAERPETDATRLAALAYLRP